MVNDDLDLCILLTEICPFQWIASYTIKPIVNIKEHVRQNNDLDLHCKY